ncbi:MAG: DNA repair protein RadC [Nitrospira sp.]|nr:DNA repair protein RadC [Nitrospira sp.]
MAQKSVSRTHHDQATSLQCVPLFRLQVVKEPHSPLYGVPKISASGDVRQLVEAHFDGRPHEEFLVVFLDAKHRPTGYQVVSVGSLTLSIVHPREVFKAAVCMNAAAVICIHNHPSGDPTPSQEDRALTKRLMESGELLGIRVLDHVVIGEDRHVSFADEGWL